LDPNIVTHIIGSCRISSRIGKGLSSGKELTRDPVKMIDVVLDLARQLSVWRNSLPVELRPDDHLQHFHVSPNTNPLTVTRIHASYYDQLMRLHALFAYPWITEGFFNEDTNPDFRAKINGQIRRSSETMAAAARNIIIMARAFDINGSCTYAYVNLSSRHFLLAVSDTC
jgi:hypothetical protein